jgi:hypothetical protein
VEGDSIYNGAIDNATGTAALLELAQAYRALPQACAFGGVHCDHAEEQGLLGSYHYADHPCFRSRTIGVINMDALFPFRDFNGMTVVGLGSWVGELLGWREGNGAHVAADPNGIQRLLPLDHYPFAKKASRLFSRWAARSTTRRRPRMSKPSAIT